MIELVAPKGLGDAIYLRAIVFHLLGKNQQVTVYTPWPQVFCDLKITIRRMGELSKAVNVLPVAYSRKCHDTQEYDALDQFRRGCIRAGFHEPINLKMFWRVQRESLLRDIRKRADGRKIVIYQPLKGFNNPYQELLRPDPRSFYGHLDAYNGCYLIKVGDPSFVAPQKARCDLDLVGKATIHDVFDLATIADDFYCEPCFLVVLAEATDKPFTCMFAQRGLISEVGCVSDVNPKRIFNKPNLATAVYDG